ncbi:MAG: CPBP family intramembrane metalloprotease, partial [Candidatus Eisenbacteria bacterium]|nr:CPBP family intramembrane metalloprotease [Candidatus Eisenbacteria bacterium]
MGLFNASPIRMITGIILAIIVFILSGSISQIIGGRIPETLSYKEWLSTSIFQLLMATVSILLMLILGRGNLRRFGFCVGMRFSIVKLLLLVLAAEIVVMIPFSFFLGDGEGHFADEFTFLQMVIGIWIIASTCEEVVMRGLIQGYLDPLKKHGIGFGRIFFSLPVITCALLFSAMHVPLLIMGIDTALGISILISTFLLGLIAGYYRENTGSLIPAIIAHSAANIFGVGLEWFIGMFLLVLCLPGLAFGGISGYSAPAGGVEEFFPQPSIVYNPEHYICYRAASPLTIDGLLDESAWAQAEWTKDFVDIEGAAKPAPRFRTRVKMLWNDEYFYVGAELEEPHIWAKLTDRDAVIFYDNDFEVFIDPDGDTHQYYELEVNALGTVWDLFLVQPYRDGGPAVNAWDIQGLLIGVHVEGTLNNPKDTDTSWSVEFAIPWNVLKESAHKEAPPHSGDQWRVNFSRVEWKTEIIDGDYIKVKDSKTGKTMPEDNWVWSPQGLINMHYPEMWGIVQFLDQTVRAPGDKICQPEAWEYIWVLRQIYYMEKNYYLRHREYSN